MILGPGVYKQKLRVNTATSRTAVIICIGRADVEWPTVDYTLGRRHTDTHRHAQTRTDTHRLDDDNWSPAISKSNAEEPRRNGAINRLRIPRMTPSAPEQLSPPMDSIK